MSPKVPKAYLDARRDEIIEAARKCFLEKGFHNTTMQDIYATTNLSPGAVYNYFASKEEIVTASIKRYTDWSISSLKSLISENPDESFIKYFQFLFSSVMENDNAKDFSVSLDFYSEATRNSRIREVMVKSMNATGLKLIEPIKRKQSTGMINPRIDALSIAHVMVGMVFAAAIHKMLEPDFDMKNYGQVCEAMITGTFISTPVKRRKTKQSMSKHRQVTDTSKDQV
jgi:AcrR family transcriptional regulator